MRSSRHAPAPWAALLLGWLLIMAGLGGSWGSVYGQTAGPTPTITGGEVVVRKRVDRAVANPGETVIFTIQVTNETQQTQKAVVRDPIVAFLEIVEATTTKGQARVEGQTVSVEIGLLEPGETVTITIVTTIRPGTTPQQAVNIADLYVGEMTGVDLPIRSAPVAVGVLIPAPAGLPNTGAAAGAAWPLIGAGAVLMLAGLLLLRRREPQH